MKLGKKTALGAGAAAGGAAGGALLAKSAGGFKAIGVALAALFSHSGGEVGAVAPVLTRSATELTALAPAVSRTPTELTALAPATRQAPSVVSQVVVQTLVRIPGQERDQLATLAGEQRDRFLVLVAGQDIRAQGLKAYFRGPFRDWGVDTIGAYRRLGQTEVSQLLEAARRLSPSSDRWDRYDRDFRALVK